MSGPAYYKMDNVKLSVRELRWMFPNSFFQFSIALLLKILRVRLKINTATTRLDKLERIEETQLDDSLRNEVTPILEKCRAAGAVFQFYFSNDGDLSDVTKCFSVLIGHDGRCVVLVLYARNQHFSELDVVCFSKFHDGSLLSTSNKAPSFHVPPNVYQESLAGADPQTLFERHSQRLCAFKTAQPLVVTPVSVESILVDIMNSGLDEKVARGLFVKMSDAEVEALRERLKNTVQRCDATHPTS